MVRVNPPAAITHAAPDEMIARPTVGKLAGIQLNALAGAKPPDIGTLENVGLCGGNGFVRQIADAAIRIRCREQINRRIARSLDIPTSPQLNVMVLPGGKAASKLVVMPQTQSRVKSSKSRLLGMAR